MDYQLHDFSSGTSGMHLGK